MTKRVAYQGIQGSFSYITALRCFKNGWQLTGERTFRDVFEKIQNDEVDVGLLAIENTTIGSITENYDLLLEYPELSIVAETYTPVHHSLLVLDECKSVKEIKKVFSHPKALEQCTVFLEKNPHIEVVSYYDTAAAAAMIAREKNPSYAAIAHACNAQLYGLKELCPHIEDDQQNTTRFLAISKTKSEGEKSKCTLTFTIDHKPGSLSEALKKFSGYNLTKIESRPMRGKPFEYRFFIDLDMPEPLEQLYEFKILGVYGTI